MEFIGLDDEPLSGNRPDKFYSCLPNGMIPFQDICEGCLLIVPQTRPDDSYTEYEDSDRGQPEVAEEEAEEAVMVNLIALLEESSLNSVD